MVVLFWQAVSLLYNSFEIFRPTKAIALGNGIIAQRVVLVFCLILVIE
ncbi:hypothetical protein [Okeania sp. SIO2C9]|nr:hypothetical protein [Okeania sp. SIO2C9]